MAAIGTDIDRAMGLLNAGELVAIPTETVYGLAGNALRPDVVARIFSVKNRPRFDPLIVHVPDLAQAALYTSGLPEKAELLAKKFWPGPLTLLLRKAPSIPDLVTAGMGTVGIRCPAHPLALQLLEAITFPLAAPSANPFGYVSPTRAQHVNEQLGELIPYVLDGGDCRVGIESTIVGFTNGDPVVYRLGGLRIEEIEELIGPVTVRINSTSDPKAPGQFRSHYAPKKKVVVGDLKNLLKQYGTQRVAVLSFASDMKVPHQFVLSPSGSLEEAAQRLFVALRYLEKLPVDFILAELAPSHGLGLAINDRLRRAAVIP